MRKVLFVYATALLALWVLLTWSIAPAQLGLGTLIVAGVVAFTRRLITADPAPLLRPRALPLLVRYAVLLVRDLSRAVALIAVRLLVPRAEGSIEDVLIETGVANPVLSAVLAVTATLIGESAAASMEPGSGRLLLRVSSPRKDAADRARRLMDPYVRMARELSC